MKTILVPTDFSEAANNAAEYAVNLAKEINAEVILMHAYHVPPMTDSMLPVEYTTLEDVQMLNEKSMLENVIALTKKTGVKVKHELKMGFAVDEITHYEKEVDYIVMGMRGAGALSEAFFGSITTDTMKKTTKPVLVIPENAKYSSLKKVVFACDSDASGGSKTIQPLKDLIKPFNSKLFVVNVIHEKSDSKYDDAINGVQLDQNLSGINHSFHFPESENVIEEISHFSENHNADLIAIVPHRHNLIERLFQKSHSKTLAFHTKIPLLALPDMHKSIPVYAL